MTGVIHFNSKGSVLFLATVAACFLSALILLAVEVFSLSIQVLSNYEAALQLFYVAEAGLAHGQAYCTNYECEEQFGPEEESGLEGENSVENQSFPFNEWVEYGRGEYFLEIFFLGLGEVQPYLNKNSGMLIVATAALKERDSYKTLCLLLEEGPPWEPVAWWEP